MEKIKDFLYEKSDIFFASIVVVLVATVVLYNLNGWLVIDSEASRYHEIPVMSENGKKPEDNALLTNPAEGKKEKSKAENKKEQKESTQQKNENKAEQKNKETEEKVKQEKSEAEKKKTQEQKKTKDSKKNDQKSQEQKQQENKNEQKKPEQQKQEKKTSNRTITIASGSTAKSIANSLKSQGIISDTNTFLNSLVASGKETKLKAGTFTIPEGSSNDQIISILTK